MMSPKQRRKYSVNVTRGSGARAQVAAAACGPGGESENREEVSPGPALLVYLTLDSAHRQQDTKHSHFTVTSPSGSEAREGKQT